VNKKQFNFFLQAAICLLLFSCTKNQLTPAAFLKYINDPENGLSKERKIEALNIKLKYLPPGYLAYKEYKDIGVKGQQQLDSIQKLYANSLTFVMELSPEDQKAQDVMLQDIQSEEEFKERVNTMNFNMKEFLELEIEGKTLSPTIANLENIYGLKNSRKIIIVFPVEIEKIKKGKNLKFTYVDEIYATGVNNFEFLSDDLVNVPSIKL
jgi:hypothetical protein